VTVWNSLLAKLRPRQAANSITNYHFGEEFHAGMNGIAVYEPAFSTPIVSLIGVGTEYRASFNATQPPQHLIEAPLGLVRGLRNAVGDWEAAPPLEI
jgi:hypothetical protein